MLAFAQWIDDFAPADLEAKPQVFVNNLTYFSFMVSCGTHIIPS